MPTARGRLSVARSAATSGSTCDPPVSGGRRSPIFDSRGHRGSVAEVEPGLLGIDIEPSVGIGQRALLVQTPGGNLLWDSTGYLDDDLVEALSAAGGVAVIAASHPHMFGVQVEWSHRFQGAPVYVAEADREWVQRNDSVVRLWDEPVEVLPGVTLHRIGGHFPGSAVAHFVGADGSGVLLSGDTVAGTPDQHWVSFMRSYPNKLPMSAAVIEKVAEPGAGAGLRPAVRQLRWPGSRRRAVPGCAVRPIATSAGCGATSTTSPAEQQSLRYGTTKQDRDMRSDSARRLIAALAAILVALGCAVVPTAQAAEQIVETELMIAGHPRAGRQAGQDRRDDHDDRSGDRRRPAIVLAHGFGGTKADSLEHRPHAGPRRLHGDHLHRPRIRRRPVARSTWTIRRTRVRTSRSSSTWPRPAPRWSRTATIR